MSRSYRKTPIFGNGGSADSEKKDKRIANRRFRRVTRELLDSDNEDYPEYIQEVSEVWSHLKDGKHYRKNPNKEDMAK